MIDFLIQFLVDYPICANSDTSVTDFSKIFNRYIQEGDFVLNLIAVVPLQLIKLRKNYHELFYIVKIVRIKRGLEKLDIYVRAHDILQENLNAKPSRYYLKQPSPGRE